MTSTKRLKSVIQSTAHHAISGLCYIHPHLGEVCNKLGIKSIRINLMKPGFDVELPSVSKALKLSTDALRERYTALLTVENIQASEIKSTYATFFFLHDEWPVSCYIKVITIEGKKADVAVELSGKTVEVLHTDNKITSV